MLRYGVFVCFLAFIGRHQVLFGIVPIDVEHASSESCKSIYPVAVANSQENRLEPGLSLRFQVAGYLLLVAGEVASFLSATSTVFQKALLPQKSNLYQEYSYH